MRRLDPVDIVAVWLPVTVHAVVMAFAIGVAGLWIVIASGRLPV